MASGPTINFGGLASGLDTNTIVDQLMAIERQPQNRLKLRQGQIDTRKTALSDIASRLKNLRLAAQDLKSPALWADTQTVDVNDATKLTAVRTGPAGTGSYQVSVTQLSSAYQHWYTYAPSASDDSITVGGRSYAITAGSDLATIANTINADASGVVYASAVTAADGTKYLALSSRKTGSALANDFSVSGSGTALFTEDPAKLVTGITASPQLQRRQSGKRQHDRNDPEADDNLRLGPALLLEVMVQRRHHEHALSRKLERNDLHDYRHRLKHEQATDDTEYYLVFGSHSDRAEQAAKCERTGVAHEDRGRRSVEPEKAHPCPNHGTAKHRKFAGSWHKMDLQVVAIHGVADQIADREKAC